MMDTSDPREDPPEEDLLLDPPDEERLRDPLAVPFVVLFRSLLAILVVSNTLHRIDNDGQRTKFYVFNSLIRAEARLYVYLRGSMSLKCTENNFVEKLH